MTPWIMMVAGLALLGFFCFGGRVIGNGARDYVASAARAFVVPWCVLSLGNVWVRWWSGSSLGGEMVWLMPVVAIPVLASFAVWSRWRS